MIGRITAIAVLALTATPAQAQQKGEQVVVLGCVIAGAERGCVAIKDRQTEKTYQVGATRPRPNPAQRLMVLVTGQVTDKADTCQQGPVLENITWVYSKLVCDVEPGQKKDAPRRRGKKKEE